MIFDQRALVSLFSCLNGLGCMVTGGLMWPVLHCGTIFPKILDYLERSFIRFKKNIENLSFYQDLSRLL